MQDLPNRFRSVQVLVAGDLMLDEYLTGTVRRISPEAPVPVVDVSDRKYVAGGAANVAANVLSLGAQVHLIGVCGQDRAGDVLRELLAGIGIDTSTLVLCPDRPTTSKIRVMAGQQQIVRVDTEDRSALPAAYRAELQANFAALLDTCDICIFSDYGKGAVSTEFCRSALAQAQARDRRVLVDPKGLDYTKYTGCSLIKPNLTEAGHAANIAIDSEAGLFEAGMKLLRQLPGSSVMVTRGPDGMTLFEPGEAPITVPTIAQQVFDVVGAGDTAMAALAIALAAGLSMREAMRLANVAAGIAVGKHGTVAVSLDELLQHCEIPEPVRA
jgi:D-beta-D-heptose 7-phosphate kinase/D-beta-D-heptose 1-phosphate adenosyltransferase